MAVCHASKGHGRNILLTLCVHVAVCHALKGHCRNILHPLCVHVSVCHASKGYDSNILLTLIFFLLCDSLNDSSSFFVSFSAFL